MPIELHEGMMKKSLIGLFIILMMGSSFGCATRKEEFVSIVQSNDSYLTCTSIAQLQKKQQKHQSQDGTYESGYVGVSNSAFVYLLPFMWPLILLSVIIGNPVLIYEDARSIDREIANIRIRQKWLTELASEKGC